MISKSEMKWISKQLELGQVSGIVANRTIQALKNLQHHVSQSQSHVRNLQAVIKRHKETPANKDYNKQATMLKHRIKQCDKYKKKNHALRVEVRKLAKENKKAPAETHNNGEAIRLQDIVNRQTKIIAALKSELIASERMISQLVFDLDAARNETKTKV